MSRSAHGTLHHGSGRSSGAAPRSVWSLGRPGGSISCGEQQHSLETKSVRTLVALSHVVDGACFEVAIELNSRMLHDATWGVWLDIEAVAASLGSGRA